MHSSQLDNKGYIASTNGDPVAGVPAKAVVGENALSLRDFFRVIKQRLWLILLTAFVCAGAAIGFDLMQTPTYEGSIKILVGQERTSDRNVPTQGAGELQQLTRTMAESVESSRVAEEVVRRLGLQTTPEEFLKRQTAKQVFETQLIQVDFEDTSPQTAQLVATPLGTCSLKRSPRSARAPAL
jgi:succinoglycan biosynthesis transport protein ExoP